MKKNIKTLFQALPFVAASLTLSQKADGQAIKKDHKVKMEIENPNTAYLTFQPGDMGIGFGYSRKITPQLGTYAFASRGNYKFNGGSYIKDHNAFGLGGLVRLRENGDGSQGFLSGGVSYHTYGEKFYKPGELNEDAFNPFSMDLGAGVEWNHWGVGINFDITKSQGQINLRHSF